VISAICRLPSGARLQGKAPYCWRFIRSPRSPAPSKTQRLTPLPAKL
jgi:hypothetical protein